MKFDPRKCCFHSEALCIAVKLCTLLFLLAWVGMCIVPSKFSVIYIKWLFYFLQIDNEIMAKGYVFFINKCKFNLHCRCYHLRSTYFNLWTYNLKIIHFCLFHFEVFRTFDLLDFTDCNAYTCCISHRTNFSSLWISKQEMLPFEFHIAEAIFLPWQIGDLSIEIIECFLAMTREFKHLTIC